jgi:hypothetical protein
LSGRERRNKRKNTKQDDEAEHTDYADGKQSDAAMLLSEFPPDLFSIRGIGVIRGFPTEFLTR